MSWKVGGQSTRVDCAVLQARMSQATQATTMEPTSATSGSPNPARVVCLPPVGEEARSEFKEQTRYMFPFLTTGFEFTSAHCFVIFRYPEDAANAAPILGGRLVAAVEFPDADVTLLEEAFAGLTIEPDVMHAHGACHEGCALCMEERAAADAEAEYWRQEDAYWHQREEEDTCRGCGYEEMACRCDDGDCDDYYSEDDEDHGPRCRCCGYADDEVGNRYPGYCGYSCAHDEDDW